MIVSSICHRVSSEFSTNISKVTNPLGLHLDIVPDLDQSEYWRDQLSGYRYGSKFRKTSVWITDKFFKGTCCVQVCAPPRSETQFNFVRNVWVPTSLAYNKRTCIHFTEIWQQQIDDTDIQRVWDLVVFTTQCKLTNLWLKMDLMNIWYIKTESISVIGKSSGHSYQAELARSAVFFDTACFTRSTDRHTISPECF